MTAWKECKLGDVIELKRGYDLPHGQRSPGPYPIISSSGVTDHHSAAKAKGPGVVTGRYGTLGEVFYVESDYWPLNTSLYVRDFKGNEPRFIYYFLKTLNFGSQNAAGAVPGVNRNHLHAMDVVLPPLPAQKRIAGILSAYDELIENSQRRIKILETMARALYREWFVHFRFPGHEDHPRVDSPLGEIPQGWEITDLKSVCESHKGIQTGPFGSQLHESDYTEHGVPVVMPKDLIGFRIKTTSIARIPEHTAENLSRHRMALGDIVYGRRGDIGRRAFVMPHQTGWLCGTGCLRVRPNARAVDGWYLFNYLGQDDIVGLIKGRAQGVTMPNLNTGLLSSVPVRLPPRALQNEYSRLTFPMAKMQDALVAKIENLRSTRDLLLPRLLSGQINV